MLAQAQSGWVELFNGRDLEGWRASENTGSWKVIDGALAAVGPRSHLFYTGPVNNANFTNFELEVQVMAKPLCNSGVYFHTAWQESDFPKQGFEIQVNNTATGEGGYAERKKTGSLYGVRNVYRQLIPDNQWFTIRAAVRGKSVQISLDKTPVVDYVEPTPPVIPEGAETGRFLQSGTFALQCHNDGSYAFYRSVRVRPLPGGNAATVFTADDFFREALHAGRRNFPMIDFHVPFTNSRDLEKSLARSRRDGIACGVVSRARDDREAASFLKMVRGTPAFAGLDADSSRVSPAVREAFDYTFAGNTISAKGRTGTVLDGLSRQPSAQTIREAKSSGAKFVFANGCDYGLRMIRECELAWQDFLTPPQSQI